MSWMMRRFTCSRFATSIPRWAARSSEAFVYAPSAIATPTVAKKPKLMRPVCTGCVPVDLALDQPPQVEPEQA